MARRDRDDDSIREPKYGTEDKYSKRLKNIFYLNFFLILSFVDLKSVLNRSSFDQF